MNTSKDLTNLDKLTEEVKSDPKWALQNASLNDFRLIAFATSEEVYSMLMEKMGDDKEAQELLFMYSHLLLCQHETDNLVLGDLDEAKKIICKVFTPELKAKKEKEISDIFSSLSPKARKSVKRIAQNKKTISLNQPVRAS